MSNSKSQFPNYKQIPNPNFQISKSKILLATCYLLLATFFIGCASGPYSYFRARPMPKEQYVKLAIIPFTNLTTERDADKKVAYALITHILNSNYFDVVEMGETQKAIKESKARKDEDLSVDDIKKIGDLTSADALVMGVVEEYKIDSSTMLGEKVFVPEAALSIRLVSVKDGSIIWSANHHRRGDDRVTIFGMGRVDSISKLTDIIIRDTVNSLVKAMRSRRDAVDILKEGMVLKEAANPKPVDAKERSRVIEKSITEVKKEQPEKEAAIPEEASPAAPLAADETAIAPKDERGRIKEEYQEEYEKIERQYNKELE